SEHISILRSVIEHRRVKPGLDPGAVRLLRRTVLEHSVVQPTLVADRATVVADVVAGVRPQGPVPRTRGRWHQVDVPPCRVWRWKDHPVVGSFGLAQI